MFCLISFLIVCIGGINWLCIGLFQFDLIAGIFGSQANFLSRFLYMIIGLATICSLLALPIQKGRIYEPKSIESKKSTTSAPSQHKKGKTKSIGKEDTTQKENEEDFQNIHKKSEKAK